MKHNKNFLPTLFVALFLWLAFLFLVVFTAPSSPLLLTTFYLLLFLALFLTFSLVLANSRRGGLLAAGMTVFLLLRQTQMVNYLNLILLMGILISLELYLRKR